MKETYCKTRDQNIISCIVFLFLVKRLTIRQIADEVGLSKSSVHKMLHDIDSPEMRDHIRYQLKYNKTRKCMPRTYWGRYDL